jgi:uncharacterized protein (TIGR03435 family)
MSVRTGLLACALLAIPAAAQPQAFEVVSVKPDKTGDPRQMRMQVLPGRFSASALPLRVLLSYAYEFPMNPSSRVIGIPDWVNREMYDIEAKAPEGSFPAGLSATEVKARMQPLLRRMLADVFKLNMRVETKDLPAYLLTVASGGPKLQPSATAEKDCPVGPMSAETCHQINGGMGRGLHSKAVTMSDVAHHIENWTDLPVLDRTGLPGLYAIDTEGWVPMALPPPPPTNIPAVRPTGGDGDMFDPARPTIFVILRRLGLDLKKDRGPVQTFTVEHIEKPAEN